MEILMGFGVILLIIGIILLCVSVDEKDDYKTSLAAIILICGFVIIVALSLVWYSTTGNITLFIK